MTPEEAEGARREIASLRAQLAAERERAERAVEARNRAEARALTIAENALAEVERPTTGMPLGAPGSVMRRAQILGQRLKAAEQKRALAAEQKRAVDALEAENVALRAFLDAARDGITLCVEDSCEELATCKACLSPTRTRWSCDAHAIDGATDLPWAALVREMEAPR